jgi:PEP-CTERM motif
METSKRLCVSGTYVLLFMALGLATGPAWAQTTINTSWIGANNNGSWTTPSNWSCNCVPNNNSANVFNVTVPALSLLTLEPFSTVEVSSLTNAAYTLDDQSTLTVSGDLTQAGGIFIDGYSPTGSPATLNVGGNLTNSGIFSTGGGNLVTVNVSGNLANTSSGDIGIGVGIDATGAVSVAGTTNNAGQIGLSGVLKTGNFSNSGFVGIAGLPGTGGALLTVSSGGSYTQTAGFTQVYGTLMAPSVGVTGGTLYGSGAINGNVVSGGVVSPGGADIYDGVFSPDLETGTTLAINGNYSQNADGTLVIGISSATDYSVLDVSGKASLDGTVDFDFLNGYLPGANTDFAFLEAGSVTGDFSALDFSALGFTGVNCPSCTFNLSTLSLDTGSTPPSYGNRTPEPGTLILFGTGLLGLAALLRKKLWPLVPDEW